MNKSKLILLLGPAAGLSLVVLAYLLIIGGDSPRSRRQSASATLPKQSPAESAPAMDLAGGVTLPGGGGISFTIYDEHTGRPTDRFRCQTWQPVPDSENEVYVKSPELTLLLPSGMTATISAEEGQIMAERIRKSQGKPRMGWLRGSATIVIDRGVASDRPPAESRPDDLITIRMERIEFDLELGKMRCPDTVRVTSPDYEIVGAELDLEFNRADNRIQQLRLGRGDHLVLRTAGAGFGGLFGAGRSPASQPASAVASQRAASDPEAEPPPRPSKKKLLRPTGYRCVLRGDVVADQYVGDERIGGLEADEIAITFDMGGGSADPSLSRRPATASAPASQPGGDEQRLLVHWRGPLEMTPADFPARPGPARRRFEAAGQPVLLEQGEGFVRCDRLEYFDETQQAWLYADAGQIEFGRGQGLRATADSVYIDRRRNIIKLLGAVELSSGKHAQSPAPPSSASSAAPALPEPHVSANPSEPGAPGTKLPPRARPGSERSTIRCDQWAELKLSDARDDSPPSAAAQPAASRPAGPDLSRIEWARFAGNVAVAMSGQTLSSDELFVSLRSGPSLEQSLDTADARGNVRLAGNRQSLECARLHARFAIHHDRVYPEFVDAAGDVHIRRGRTRVRGGRVEAVLAPPPEGAESSADLLLRTVDVHERAELRDPDNRVAARGSHIRALFSGAGELAQASVMGRGDQLGMVEASPYVVRGEQIDVDRARQALSVNGPSQASFVSRRGLSGNQHARPQTVTVTAATSLAIDGQANVVLFTGDVHAASQNEQLQADRLTLHLQDVADSPPPPSTAAAPSEDELPPAPRPEEIAAALLPHSFAQIIRAATLMWAFAPSQQDQPRSAEPRTRKEPVRVLAENAIVRTATPQPGQVLPLTEAEIVAPNRLEADLLRRVITTTGQTVLLTTNRRLNMDAEALREAAGSASALIGGGPSQTAMECHDGMTYTLGSDGPGRRDIALFTGEVRFIHRAGRDMLRLEEVLPQLRDDPRSLARLKSRITTLNCERLECEFIADSADSGRPASGRSRPAAPLQLAWIMASRNAYLRDQQGPAIREVIGDTLEFSREAGLVRVRGSEQSQARIYFENAETGQHDQPMVGNELVIDLKTNAVRAGPVRMEFHRP